MEIKLGSRIKSAWNAFTNNRDPTLSVGSVVSYGSRPDRPRLSRGNERSIVNAIFNRIALDVASVDIRHVRLDTSKRYLDEVDSGLNSCLSFEANLDQTARAFIQDVVVSMFDEGCVAIVPIDTDDWNKEGQPKDIYSLRTAKILEWFPRHVRLRVYNDRTGKREDIVLPKESVAIIENPLYSVINEPNSTMQRLIRKLNLLDSVEEQASSGKLDLIIQVPYVIKSDARRVQAEARRREIETQLAGSKYGIAYADGTEKIIQLNRSVENNLLKTVEYLTNLLFGQIGFDQSILSNTADEKTMLNYNNRIIEPILSAITVAMRNRFLTTERLNDRETIMYYRDPFRLVPVASIAEIADKFTRNEIVSSNEIRQIIGMKPSDDPKADELRNKNLSESSGNQNGDDGSNFDRKAIEKRVLEKVSKEVDNE